MIARLFGSLYLLSSFALFVFAQEAVKPDENSSPENEKIALALLEQTVNETDSLKLSENRIYIFATAADLLWTRQEKRACALFQRAAGELSASFNENDDGENSMNSYILSYGK